MPEQDAKTLLMVVHGTYPVDPRVAREARVAQAEGFEVDVIALRGPGQPRTDVVEGSRVVRLPVPSFSRLRLGPVVGEYILFTFLASVRAALLHSRRRYDVVQVHNPPDFLMAAALLPKLAGSGVVFDIHDLSSDMFSMRFGNMPFPSLFARALNEVERLAAHLSNAVITVHAPYRRELERRGVNPSKITVVMNSVDEALLPSTAPPPEGPGSGFRIVYHGSLTPHYGVELLVRAASELRAEVPGLCLEIFGQGDAAARIAQATTELGFESHVSLVSSFLPQVEVLERIQGASVGVVPNLPWQINRFALSSKLLECVALGIPVVAADLPTLREHFSSDEVRYFTAGDQSALAEALLDVARDPQAARTRARAALARYSEYRWEVSARRYARVLERVRGGKRARGWVRRRPSQSSRPDPSVSSPG
ncbi:MAG: glycosyltransferase family 4 protein [Gaiellaceae bacterium]